MQRFSRSRLFALFAAVLAFGFVIGVLAGPAAGSGSLFQIDNRGRVTREWTPITGTGCYEASNGGMLSPTRSRTDCTVATTTTTTVAPTTTTVAPTTSTTSTTTTTVAPTTTSTSTTSTTQPPSGGGDFVETFDGNGGLDRFVTGVFNRDGATNGTVSADHDLNCGTPDTQRIVRGSNPSESFYVCRDHLMTAVGDWSGYSVAWFEPNTTFTRADQRVVAWDVNITNLLARQWWEVMIVPVSWSSGEPACPHCAVQPWLSPDPAHLPGYPSSAIVVGNGAFGNDVNIQAGGQERYTDWRKTCDRDWGWFTPTECADKMKRPPFSITDNGNGTITVSYGGKFTETFSGQFPAEYRVVFKDHNYTPDKDGTPIGHTWHWDNIVIR